METFFYWSWIFFFKTHHGRFSFFENVLFFWSTLQILRVLHINFTAGILMEIYLQFNFELWPGRNEMTSPLNGKFILLLIFDIQVQSRSKSEWHFVILHPSSPYTLRLTFIDLMQSVPTIEIQRYLTTHSFPECGFEDLKQWSAPAHIWDLPR